MREFYERLPALLERHGSLVLATVVEVAGSSPRDEGAKMVVLPDGALVGTLGGGSLESQVLADALECLRSQTSALKSYDLSESGLGMKCGGRVQVFLEPVCPARRLVIFGGGHVGKAIARLAVEAGFATEVVDDRPEHLDPSAYPARVRLIKTDAGFREGYDALRALDFAVVVTREADLDADLAGRCAGTCAYAGVMGSLRKLAFIKKRLSSAGVPQETIEKIRCPMGLDIGSDTPMEIAFSVMAELIALRASLRRMP